MCNKKSRARLRCQKSLSTEHAMKNGNFKLMTLLRINGCDNFQHPLRFAYDSYFLDLGKMWTEHQPPTTLKINHLLHSWALHCFDITRTSTLHWLWINLKLFIEWVNVSLFWRGKNDLHTKNRLEKNNAIIFPPNICTDIVRWNEINDNDGINYT